MTDYNKNLHWYILVSLIFACIAGYNTSQDLTILNLNIYNLYTLLGDMFLNGLRLLSIPLIICSIISGMASIGSTQTIGQLGVRTLLYYAFTGIIAIFVGLIIINLVAPGYDDQLISAQNDSTLAKLQSVFSAGVDDSTFTHIFYQLVPKNIFAAAAKGELLGVIIFSILFGYFILQLKDQEKKLLTQFWTASFNTIMLFTVWFLKFAPIGVFGLVAKSIADTGFDTFLPLMKFFVSVILALSIHTFVVLSLLLYFVGRINPLKHFRAMLPALLTAFSTSSSSATLPVTMECTEKNAGVSNKVSSFVLPLGATVNMNGTALYECMAAIFIAQTYGLSVGLSQQFFILLVALLTSVGVAGIPSASLVAITIILTSIGIPLEAMGLLMVTDRILDMCRTAVNIYSDSCGAAIIANNMGKKNLVPKEITV